MQPVARERLGGGAVARCRGAARRRGSTVRVAAQRPVRAAAARRASARAAPRASSSGDGAQGGEAESVEAEDEQDPGDVTVQGNQVVKDAVKDLRELQKSEREVLNQAADLLEQLGVKMPRVPENIRDVEEDYEED
eukprot:CAMPEP_0119164762 /NCGR_PEP_ID=MMETSP1315-20130426/4566_1 /TAXON_ID=676789 /ORGANISM="Prasinoderma singularis, Strain RCC927" /LENGTH=135 /DNA_ID=CAMNT_0007157967 /DNA_START=6 /DNA_END=413 /DNA_ORIENTATION=+